VVSLPNDPSRETFTAAVAALTGSGQTVDDARTAVASRHGFSGWSALAAYLDLTDELRRDNDPHITTETVADEFCRLACLTFSDDPPERRAAARELLGVHPELTEEHIWAAAAASDADAVRRFLAERPELADTDGGPYGWKPLHYLAYSRVSRSPSAADAVATARLLIAAGADPNAGYLWGGLPTPFTVLTGVFGEGEQGPGRCPRHPHERALAELLLVAGADPNDGQTLYNRMFRPDDGHLDLLFAHGLGRGIGGPWRLRLGEAGESPQRMIDYQLNWAVAHGYANRVAKLLDHGANPNHVTPRGVPAVAVAAANGDRTTVALLLAAGAIAPELTGLDAFVADCLAGDADAVAMARESGPGLLSAALAAHPCLIARAVDAGRRDAIGLLVWLGFDVNARRDGETALHRCAWNGDIAMAQALIDVGADPSIEDDAFGATPLGWAEHACQAEFIAFIEPLTKAGKAG
jgi:ankyrin repeat protein